MCFSVRHPRSATSYRTRLHLPQKAGKSIYHRNSQRLAYKLRRLNGDAQIFGNELAEYGAWRSILS